MLMPNEEEQVRLYFTKDKICIGSYGEVAEYERKTKQSYWASDFFQLPPAYNPIGQNLEAIGLVQKQWLQTKNQ
jgi:hypothetical protein